MNPIVVIAAGGDGTRLGNFNKKGLPKGLLEFGGKPLIGYQLELLEKAGLNDILLSFSAEWQISLFKNLQKKGIVSNLNYSFDIHPHFDHPAVLFRNQGVIDSIKDRDFIYSQSDLYFKKNIFIDLIDAYKKFKCSIVTKDPSRLNDKIEILLKDGFVSSLSQSNDVKWRYGGLYLITKNASDCWLRMCKEERIKGIDFYQFALEAGERIYFLDEYLSDFGININTEKEYTQVKEIIEGALV